MVETSTLLSIIFADLRPMEVEDRDLDKEQPSRDAEDLDLGAMEANCVLDLENSEEDAFANALINRLVTEKFFSTGDDISSVAVAAVAMASRLV